MPYKDPAKRNEASRKSYTKHKKERKVTRHKYYEEHKEEILKATEEWAKFNPDKREIIERRWRNKNRKKIMLEARVIRKKKRWELIDLLGGKCSNPDCPIPIEKIDKRALQIDHVYGGGTKERKQLTTHQLEIILLKRIKSGEKIQDYQLLCAYCNWMKRYEKKEWK